MTRMAVAGCMALAALSAVAVLGVSSSTAEAAPRVSPFAGSWSGTWSILDHPEYFGTYDWTISDAGRMTGRVTNPHFNRGGTIVGHVGADGHLNMTDYVPNDERAPLADGLPFQGTAVIDGDGRLVASATDTPSQTLLLVAILERN